MKYYLAPLEGITTYIYRRAYHTLPSDGEIFHTVSGAAYQKGFLIHGRRMIFAGTQSDMYLVAADPGK